MHPVARLEWMPAAVSAITEVKCTSTGRKCDGYPIQHNKRNALVSLDPGSLLGSGCPALTSASAAASAANSNNSTSALSFPLTTATSAATPVRPPPGLNHPGCALSTFPRLSELDIRSLDFFRSIAGPALGGVFEGEFWNYVVLQLGHQEPAVRTALVAVSDLFEDLYVDNRRRRRQIQHGESSSGGIGGAARAPSAAAMQKYNAAIRQASSVSDPMVMLVACILFVCIECLLGNKHVAITHCRHGILILNTEYGDISTADSALSLVPGSAPAAPSDDSDSSSSDHSHLHRPPRGAPGQSSLSWVRDNIVPVMQRMAIFPYFFGGTVSNFPAISEGLVTPSAADASWARHHALGSVPEAQLAMDKLMARAIRFIRCTDDYRLGPLSGAETPAEMVREQREIAGELEAWAAAVETLKKAQMTADGNMYGTTQGQGWEPTEAKAMNILMMRYHVSRTWVLTSLEKSETIFDEFTPSFRSIITLAREIEVIQTGKRAASSPSPAAAAREGGIVEDDASAHDQRPPFVFEMGVLPLLYFTLMKCRILSLRVAALALIKDLAADREGLWDARTMWSIGRDVVKFEHGIAELPPPPLPAAAETAKEEGAVAVDEDEIPAQGKRLWENMLLDETETRQDPRVGLVLFQKLRFVFGTHVGDLDIMDEWVKMGDE
ncbi:uncharacterized protein MKZ38_002119 [Zalerion maritima]|uniref:Uncharacterized protein n=1 Tax=Zalerion maritima TaxID=339359 RepID=A0AAD5RPG1_9PEZI|nr:uncharacterized protein MKZ38_002119 [Zalerion maritima]